MAIIEKIISKQIIKPSSQTHNSLRHYKISFLDQLSPSVYIPYIFFYQNHDSKLNDYAQISHHLKQSLSQILPVFYPLAGTLHDNSSVECDDSGVEFVEARVEAPLARVTETPDMEELTKLVPLESGHSSNAVLSVKVNVFDCGGIAIGVSLWHKIGDTGSISLFMKAWAANFRTEYYKEVVDSTEYQPVFDLPLRFPPNEDLNSALDIFPPGVKITSRRLVFDGEKLEKLKKLQPADSVHAVSAFIWHNVMKSNKVVSDKASLVSIYSVNTKPRTIPPIPHNAFGNFGTYVIASTSETEKTYNIEDLLSKISLAASQVSDSYIENVPNYHAQHLNKLYNPDSLVLIVGDMSRIPIYDANFGWGKPDWVCLTTIPIMNFTCMFSTPSGDGIEAWTNLPDDLFQMLQQGYNSL